MAETFTWRVTIDTDADNSFVVNTAQFGDGYKQEVAEGINNIQRTFNVTLAGYKAEVAPIIAFLEAHKGAVPFLWTPEFHGQGYYTCKRFKWRPNGGGHFTLTATFDLSHLPSEPTP